MSAVVGSLAGLGALIDRRGYPRYTRHDCGGTVVITGYIAETNEQLWHCARCGDS